jgi:hypothetical protein
MPSDHLASTGRRLPAIRPQGRKAVAIASCLAAGLIAMAFTTPAVAATPRQFMLGIEEPLLEGANTASPLLLDRVQASGARILRELASWNGIAPDGDGLTVPSGFNARDPADPSYNWTQLDAVVRGAASRGLDPLLILFGAPTWAEGPDAQRAQGNQAWPHVYDPSAQALGDFAYAVARRYDGSFPDPLHPGSALPRVRYLQAWNEPNYRGDLYPQGVIANGRPVVTGAPHYVDMLNAVYDNVKQAMPSDTVVAAGLGPFGIKDRAQQDTPVADSDPQYFMRSMFCLQGRGRSLRAQPGCNRRPRFDAFAQHPYSIAGTPTSKGASADDGAIGNLPEIRHTLDVATRLGRVYPAGHKPLWVTEFDWWSDPPPASAALAPGYGVGKPLPVQARYLSESAFRMWLDGVDVLIWFELRDQAAWPGGLYLAGADPSQDTPKPALQAFELPFYAHRDRSGLLVWAVSPGGVLEIQRSAGSAWTRVADLRPNHGNVVYTHLRLRQGGVFRAVALAGPRRGLASYPYPG